MNFRSIKDFPLEGQHALLRADLNLPLVQGVITDEFRLKSILPTLRHLWAQRAKIVLICHWGRPAGKPDPRFSLSHIVPVLRRVAPDFRTIFCPDVMGGKATEAISQGKTGDIILLENLRFHPGEEANDLDFTKNTSPLSETCMSIIPFQLATAHMPLSRCPDVRVCF